MTRLAIEGIVFLAITFVVSFGFAHRRMIQPNFGDGMLGQEVFQSARECQTVFSARTLVAGDSVGNQFFDYRHVGGDIKSLACNAGITLIGQSILIDEAVKNNPQVSSVYLIIHPSSIQADLNSKYAFHYFLKPFYRKRFLPHFTEAALRDVDNVP